jgi:predicted RNase H-like HicB family nuclease
MEFEVDFELEEDGRWIAEVVCLPGVLAYGSTCEEAQAKANALAHEVVQEQAMN